MDDQTRLFLALEALVKHQMGAWFKWDSTVDTLVCATEEIIDGSFSMAEILHERMDLVHQVAQLKKELAEMTKDRDNYFNKDISQ